MSSKFLHMYIVYIVTNDTDILKADLQQWIAATLGLQAVVHHVSALVSCNNRLICQLLYTLSFKKNQTPITFKSNKSDNLLIIFCTSSN